MDIKHFVYLLLVDGHLSYFLLSANNVALNMRVQISVQVPVVSSFEHIPRSGIAGLYVILCLIF